MLDIAKTLFQKTLRLPFSAKRHQLTAIDVAPARAYIRSYWSKLERFHPKDDESLLGLPNPYLVPAHEEGHEFDFNEMYYWDSYFIAQGLWDKEHRKLAIGMLENLTFMFKRFKIVPNASRTYLMGRSQPPFLTSYILDAKTAFKLPDSWVSRQMTVAEAEYQTVWMGTTKPHWRQVYRGLSRYFDVNMLNDLAEAESGWDMTPRFGRRALAFLPVDLNALLYKYEVDFARHYRNIGDKRRAAGYEVAANHRLHTMNELMWSETRGWYYDYDFTRRRRSGVASLAGFFPAWAGMVDPPRAARMATTLRRFENRGGLATTDTQALNQFVPGMIPMQWAYPNGWAPLHLICVQGLLRYGLGDMACRLAHKWLRTNLDWFNRHGVFLEKYNVVNPEKPPVKGLYPSQTGFGWTNGVFEWLCRQFIDQQS